MRRIEAQRIPVQKGPAAWNTILGTQTPPRELLRSRTADVVIVGGGFAGLAAARRLVQLLPDARIVLLEAGRLAAGAAGRNSGFMIDLPHELTSSDYAGAGDDRAQIALNRRAIAFARAAVAEYRIPRAFFDPAGKVNGAASPKAHTHNQTYAAHLDSLDEAHERLDAQQMRDLTGSAHYMSGLYTPGTVMLQPAGYVRGLVAGLERHVTICEGSPVIALQRETDGWRVETPLAHVSAGAVILANNGHLESFGFARGRLMHLMLFASMTERLDPVNLTGAPRWGVTPSDPMGTTMRRIDPLQGGDRIVIRTCAVLRSGMAARESDLSRAARIQREKFVMRFPGLARVRMEYTWAGALCLSRNGVAVTGELEPGLFSACVQNGLGTARGTLTGIAAAETLCGVESDITRHFASEAAPSVLPPTPFRDWGANALLRWKERQARDE